MASASRIEYSEKYNDDQYEYRHVILPKERAKNIPRNTLMGEAEWRRLGVQQSRGWEHYAVHRPEPHILLFRRPHGTNPVTGCVEPELERAARLSYYRSAAGGGADDGPAAAASAGEDEEGEDEEEEQDGTAEEKRP